MMVVDVVWSMLDAAVTNWGVRKKSGAGCVILRRCGMIF